MNRLAFSALWNVIKNPIQQIYKSMNLSSAYNCGQKTFSTIPQFQKYNYIQAPSLFNRSVVQSASCNQLIQVRNLTKFSLRKGKKKTVKAVLKRFYRLDWGIWIRGRCGRQKKLYKKSSSRKRRLRQHVFCNATQSYLLDKMVTNYWRKPKYYIDDPYEPYHKREEFPITRKKPFVPDAL